MKTLVILTLIFSSLSSFAGEEKKVRLMNCIVYELLDTSDFEEGISADEYPYITLFKVGEKDAQIFMGGIYETKDGDAIREEHGYEENDEGTELWMNVFVQAKGRDTHYEIKAHTRWNSRKATLKAYDKDGSVRHIANLVCTGQHLDI